MKKLIFSFYAICFLATLHAQGAIADNPVPFPSNQGCVAWRTQETMFFFWKKTSQGLNCNISTSMQNVGPDQYRFEMVVPIAGFHSGSLVRDREIRRILKESWQPNLLVVTDARTPAQWREFTKDGQSEMKGYLSLAGRSYKLNSNLFVTAGDNESRLIHGRINTSFYQLGIKPPVVFLGAFTKVAQELELSFQLPTRETLNFQRVAGPK